MKNSLSADVQERIQCLVDLHVSRIGISVANADGYIYGWRQEEVFDTACGIMCFIMAEYYRQYSEGLISGEERLIYTAENYATGAGTIKHASFGTRIIARDALYLMIAISDHIAANLLVDFLGMENINRTIVELGFPHTRLNCKFLIPHARNVGESTPAECSDFYSRILKGDLLSGTICGRMMGILRQQRYKDILTDAIRASSTRNYIDVASKSGKADGRINRINSYLMDSGIIFTTRGNYAISLFADIPLNTESLEVNKKTLNQISLMIFNDLVEWDLR